MSFTEFEKRLYRDIPMAQTLAVRCVEIRDSGVVLTAPLSPNVNHRGTAFGGSIFSVAVLSCWVLVTEMVRANGLNAQYVVVQDGQIRYEKPIQADFAAHSAWADSEDPQEKFLATLKKRGRARAELKASVQVADVTCATLSARFAVELKRE